MKLKKGVVKVPFDVLIKHYPINAIQHIIILTLVPITEIASTTESAFFVVLFTLGFAVLGLLARFLDFSLISIHFGFARL